MSFCPSGSRPLGKGQKVLVLVRRVQVAMVARRPGTRVGLVGWRLENVPMAVTCILAAVINRETVGVGFRAVSQCAFELDRVVAGTSPCVRSRKRRALRGRMIKVIVARLDPAPGEFASVRFLNLLATGDLFGVIVTEKAHRGVEQVPVLAIVPGDLAHRVVGQLHVARLVTQFEPGAEVQARE